jgi:hypothetical protein
LVSHAGCGAAAAPSLGARIYATFRIKFEGETLNVKIHSSPSNVLGNVGMVVIGGCISNYLAVHCYQTGDMIGSSRGVHSAAIIVNARRNDPALFWIYLSIIGIGALLLDLIIVKMLYDWLRTFPHEN